MPQFELSIVVPTLNRRELLKYTLANIGEELGHLTSSQRGLIEFVVGDNASDDGTAELQAFIESLGAKYHRFDRRVEIGQSIVRSVCLATAKYVWVFGDDDIVHPGAVSHMLRRLRSQPDCAMYYMNRLVLDENIQNIISLPQSRWPALHETMAMGEFIRRFNHWPGFISAMIFSRTAFDCGADFDRAEFAGWEFLARIYRGGASGTVSVDYLPLLSQRLGRHSWKARWPRFWLVNMPRMLAALEKEQITWGAVASWAANEVTLYRFIIDLVVAKSFDYSWRDKFWAEAARWQRLERRIVLHTIRFFVPCVGARLLHRTYSKYKTNS